MSLDLSAAVLLDSAAKSTSLLLFVWLTMPLLRRASAATRHLIWLLAVGALPLIPVLSVMLPGWHILPAWMDAREAEPVAVVPSPAPALPRELPVEIFQRLPAAEPGSFGTAEVDAPPPQQLAEPQAPQSPPPVLRPPLTWRAWLVLSWAGGCAVFLATPLLGLLLLRLLERGCLRVDDRAWLTQLDQVRGELNVRRRVRLLHGHKRAMPMAWGILRPRILLPAESGHWTPQRRRMVLLHELGHIKRLDSLAHLLTQFIRAAYWFNPLIWLAEHRMRCERERACDDLVLRAGADGPDYAQELLEVTARFKSGPLSAAAIAMARPSTLEGRLLAILDGKRNRHAMTRLAIFGTMLLTVAIVVPLASLRAMAPAAGVAATEPASPASRPTATLRLHLVDPQGQPMRDSAVQPVSTGYSANLSHKIYWPDKDGLVVIDSIAQGEHTFVINASWLTPTLLRIAVNGDGQDQRIIVAPRSTNRWPDLDVQVKRRDDRGRVLMDVAISNNKDEPYTLNEYDLTLVSGDRRAFPPPSQQHSGLVIPPRGQGPKTITLDWSAYARQGLWCAREAEEIVGQWPEGQFRVKVGATHPLPIAVPLPDASTGGASASSLSQAAEELHKSFKSAQYFWQQADVAQKMIALGDKSVLPEMAQMLQSEDRHERCNAALVLAGLGDERGLEAALRELKDTAERPTRRIRSDGAPDLLGQIREDRYYAAHVLGQIGDRRAVPSLIDLLKDRAIAYKAAIVLGQLGDARAVSPLKEMLKSADPHEKLWAGYGLARIGDPAGIPAVAEFLKDPQWSIRRSVAESLGEVRGQDAVQVLIAALSDESPDVRAAAARSLGQIGDDSPVPALQKLSNDAATTTAGPPTSVRDVAAEAIRRIKASVLLVTSGNVWLTKVLDASRPLAHVTLTPEQYEQQGPGDAGVIIFDRYKPKQAPAASCIYFGVVPDTDQVRAVMRDGTAETLKDAHVDDFRQAHPTLEHISLRFLVTKAIKLDVTPGAQILASAKGNPLIVSFQQRGRTHLVLPFAIEESSWPLSPSFPVFIDRAIAWLLAGAPATRAAAEADVRGLVSSNIPVTQVTADLILAPYDGVLESVNVKPGLSIGKGLVLARLNTAEWELKLASALKQADQQKIQAAGFRQEGKINEELAAQAEAGASQKEADLMRFRISQAEIKAPISGIVRPESVFDRVGMPVKQGDGLFELAPSGGTQPAVRAPASAPVTQPAATQAATEKLWLAIMTDSETVRSARELAILVRAFNAYGSEKTVTSSDWEIRSADNSRRETVLPIRWPWGRSPEQLPPDGKRFRGWGERSARLQFDDDQARQLGALPPGEYALAWNVNGRRASNVVRLRIDPNHDITTEPLLELMPLDPAPAQDRPLIGIRARRHKQDDPAPSYSQVAYAKLIVDGQARQWEAIVWAGPDGPLPVGGHAAYLLDLSTNLAPPIEAGKSHQIMAEVGSLRTKSVELALDSALARSWDPATPKLAPATQPHISLEGTVIAPDGKPAAGYQVFVEHPDWKYRLGDLPHQTTDEQGRYRFHNLPAGQYEVWTNPTGKGPLLRVAGVDVKDGATQQLDLDLTAHFHIAGHVRDAQGRPVAGRDVMSNWRSQDGKSQYQDFAVTDGQGGYRIGSPLPTATYVGLSGTGPQPRPQRDVPSGREDVDFAVASEPSAAAPADLPPMSIRGRVTDARTGAPITSFRLIHASSEPKRELRWQGHTLTRLADEDGRYVLPLAKRYNTTLLRVDAEGYQPAISRPILNADGIATIDFQLQPASRLRGKVLTPTSQPAAGAQVTLATVTNEVRIEHGALRLAGDSRSQIGRLATCDQAGDFLLPPEIDPGTFVAVHEDGYAQVTPAELAKADGIITLRPWGNVEGRLLLGGKPTPRLLINLGTNRPNDDPCISHSVDLTTDEAGRFSADHVPPGRTYVQLISKTADGWVSIVGTGVWVDVGPGQTTSIALGGVGRPVHGQLEPPPDLPRAIDLTRIHLWVRLRAPHVGFPGDNEMWAAQSRLLSSPEGKAYYHDHVPVAADGAFRIDRLPQGSYQLIGILQTGDNGPNLRVGSGIDIAPMPDGQSNEPLDLGRIKLFAEPTTLPASQPAASPSAGSASPSIATPAGPGRGGI